jgi:ABC-type anion transport system duplicated permease subunit
LNQEYTLPGLGSYVAAAVAAEDLPALGWALLAIAPLPGESEIMQKDSSYPA